MSFKKEGFGSCELYTLTNARGTTAKITNIGAAIVSLFVRDRNDELRDVVLGYENAEDYLKPGPNHGAVCGRVANRIEDAVFTLNGREYKLKPNFQERHVLHGGFEPLSQRVFSLEASGEDYLTLRCFLPDGENGFPGNMTVDVKYTLTEDDTLRIHYIAVCDEDTVINLTNHAYFNLRGHDAGEIHDHIMTIYADTYAPLGENGMVYGALLPVPREFDFRKPMPVGKYIDAPGIRQLEIAGGYDHAWTVRNDGDAVVLCADVYCEESGIAMSVGTNSPTVLLYAGNSMPGVDYAGKGGAEYIRRGALCLETGFYPNALRFPEFGQGYLKKGETFDYTTEYSFSVK